MEIIAIMKQLILFWMLCTASVLAQPKLAILSFKNNGSQNLSALSEGIPDMLGTTISDSKKVMVVERAQIGKLMQEMQLGMTGIVEPSSAAKIGKMLGAQWVILGSFIDLGASIRLDAKVVRVESGVVIPGSAVRQKTKSIENLDQAIDQMAAELLKKLTGEISSQPAIEGFSDLPGKMSIVMEEMVMAALVLDGKTLDMTGSDISSKVSHGKHLLTLNKGVFSPKVIAKAEIFVPGGYWVRVKYAQKKFTVYETIPLPQAKKRLKKNSAQQTSTQSSQQTQIKVTQQDQADMMKMQVGPNGIQMQFSMQGNHQTQHSSQHETVVNTQTSSQIHTNEEAPAVAQPMRHSRFQAFLRSLKKESFDDVRIEMIEGQIQSEYFDVSQLKKMVALFVHEDQKLEVTQLVYPRLVDKEDIFKVYDLFEFSHTKSEMQEWIQNQ